MKDDRVHGESKHTGSGGGGGREKKGREEGEGEKGIEPTHIRKVLCSCCYRNREKHAKVGLGYNSDVVKQGIPHTKAQGEASFTKLSDGLKLHPVV